MKTIRIIITFLVGYFGISAISTGIVLAVVNSSAVSVDSEAANLSVLEWYGNFLVGYAGLGLVAIVVGLFLFIMFRLAEWTSNG